MKISQFLYHIPYKKYIAGFLISMILVSQTIHVSFFDSALAGPENYRDIVSIIVDKQTYTVQRNRILQYASDIAGYLGGVRTSILVVEKDTPVATIAEKNEQLYYEGDGDKGTSSLVGTVLIGNIPIPIVEKDGVSFSSLYPYVDFVDKSFTYDPKSTRYKYNTTDSVSESVEIWHGVMNPAVGRSWDGATDIAKIGTFLDKTHEFYTKSGKFAPSLMPPKVFYYDGLTESKSIDARGLFAYSLSMKNAENIAYNRFTKYLLRDISTAFQDFDATTKDPEISSLYASLGIPEGSDTLSEDQIKKIPDIQTKDVILGFLKNFKGIFNEKSLGEELLAVHNAGRYTSGATVSADIAPISISLMDDLARATLKTSNRALATSIDRSLESGISSKIVLFDKNIATYTGGLGDDINDPLLLSGSRTYKGYYFGMHSEEISKPSQCTIARGYAGDTSQFGRSVLVEANAAFDIGSTQGHIGALKSDTEELVNLHRSANYSCFNTSNSTAKLLSYWGDNSVLKIMGTIGTDSSADSFLFDPSPATTFKGFSSPVFSLGGMKESSRISNPSIANCIDQQYQYTLLQPYIKKYKSDDEYGPPFYSVAFPFEWNTGGRYNGDVSTLRYTCNTQHVVKNPISIATSITEYTSRTCFVGKLYLNGIVLKEATASCIKMEGFGDDMHEVDKTIYEDRYYHTIPSVWSHVSPTDDEITAAKSNGMTPSLPIDQIRYVEFLTPKGNVARINYPNFFELEGSDIASVRNWLKVKSTEQWNAIINKENSTTLTPERVVVNQQIPPGILPISPIDWNTYISDDMIEQIIQAKNWLHPDISIKYKKAIESMLSYSHVNTAATPRINTAPKIPSFSNEYEIAYLGLPSSFGPDFSRGSSSTAKAGYDTRIREIEGANISDESAGDDEDNNTENECGPPDGVPLLQWPAAIMCWIKAQFPPRILAGSCGPSTIGIGSPLATPVQSPSSLISANNIALTAFYNGSRVIPHLPRSSLQLRDGITINLDLQKNNAFLSVLPGTVAHLEIVRGTTGDKNISPSELGSYLTIAPNESPVGEKGANFVLNSLGNEAQLVLKGFYIQKLPDGSEILTNSEEFQITITPEYYSLSLEQSGSSIANIDVTSSDNTALKLQKILKDGTTTNVVTPISIEVIDDVSGDIMYTGSSYIPGSALPTTITKKIGVYRLIVRDTSGISGEFTFAVQSGIFSQIRIVPISSALVKGTKTLAMVRLLDRLGNPISPNVHLLKLDIMGGYIVDSSGDKKSSMNMDIIESQVPILIGSDASGILGIRANVDDAINTSKDITIYDTARIVLMRDAAPEVGGKPIPIHIEIQDAAGKRITGLSSVASWKFPDGAGSFSKETITITDGLSENFEYLPGTVAGNHSLSIDIPGVGSLSDIVFSLLPGVPLYISHTKDSNSIVFSLRDRYDNISSFSSLVGSLSRNNSTPQPIVFSDGIYRVPLQSGEYAISVPGLKNNSISYTEKDATGKDAIRQIFGIDIYVAYISGIQERLDFAPDYNARYTILAGGSFLREGEDILYDTTPGQSQSLAVSTILENPYKENILLSLFPGGSYSLSETAYDSTLESSISLQDGFPLLSISDLVTHKQVAKVIYRMQNALLETCKESSSAQCNVASKQSTIRLVIPSTSDLAMTIVAGTMQLNSTVANILNIQNNGIIRSNNGVTFVPKNTGTLGLEMSVMFDDKEIARLIYITDSSLSVERIAQAGNASSVNTPTILNSGFSIQKIPGNPLNPSISGYKIFRATNSDELDETKNGPGNTDSLGALSELSGVGWQGNNTMLLAYAGGDTVGETTRFFHTYTLVNLGDPVAHVDHGRPGTEKDGIDRTLGSMITRGTRSGIVDVYHRDMDSDGILDLVVLYQDGYMELFLNHGNKFRSRGMITYNKDFDSKKVSFGDFTHDGYGDIIGVNTSGDFILVDNSKRKFSRLAITLDGGSVLPKNISQFHIYDMDTDSLDDIVYITAGGELGILYGTQTPGNFVKKILDSTLGITLSDKPITVGGAIKANNTPDTVEGLGVSPTTSTGIDDSMLKGEVFYQYSHPTPIDSARVSPETLSGVFTDIADGATGNRVDIFVRSQYATAYGLTIEKKYTNTSHPTLYPDDLIQAKISIKNTSSQIIKNIEYLDSIPRIFSLEKTQKYSVTIAGTTTNRQLEPLGSSDYDMYFVGRDLAPGETMEISYDLVALPASYGEMIVGDLEKGTVGADIYGDVGFKTSTTCGANMLLWASDPALRMYTRGTHEFGETDLPDGLAARLADGDNNGTPDSIENMSLADRQKAHKDMMNSNTPQSQALIRATQDGNQFNIGFDDGAVNSVIDMTQNLLDGLSCGFGGGSCLNFPLNWAPLAPGSSPTLFGIPILPNLMTPSAGLPIFSGLTGVPIYGPWGCFPMPAVWPPSPIGLTTTCTTNIPGAGGMLGTQDPLNMFRIFVTPTLTLGMGTAICFGGPAIAMGEIPPPGLSPLIQGGNCIVMAKSMPFCKGDGSDADGNVSDVSGLGTIVDTWNATSCHPEVNVLTEVEDQTLTTDIVSYLRNPDTKRLNDMYTRIARRGPPTSGGPFLKIGNASSGDSSLDIEIDSNTKISDIGSVIKLKNKRIAAFPDFLMDWLTRQTDEITTSLFTPPNLTIVPPSSFGQNAQVDGSYKDFSKKLGAAYSTATFDNIKQGMVTTFNKKNSSIKGVPESLQSTAGNVKGTLNSIKSAYTAIGKLPFVSIKQSTIPLNIPWINKSELDKYARSLEGYKQEIDNAANKLCIKDPSPACLAKKASLKSSPFIGSIIENLKRIEEYKRFPMKIQKYITWKERYIAQVLCNINVIQQITGGWLRDNGIRFRKWAELFVLIKAIAEGWQPLLDIFTDTSKSCGVCRNERNNLQYWKFKLLSMLIPSIPVIKFPKWPDIILDLSDIRFGISISMPNFDPRISPIRLPDLPSLAIGDFSASLGLPALFLLPRIPPLPDLPDLPSLPKIKLPNLPPPPKLPKIAGSIAAFLKIMKLISKMYCFYQKTFLVPEWQAGDIIAQRTERQGTMPFDFINLSLPQFSLPSLKEIRVGSHVNYSLRSEFISEFARTAVKPVNSFQTDLKMGIPKKIGEDVNIQSVKIDKKINFNIEENIHTATGIMATVFASFENDKNIFLETDEFTSYIMSELDIPEFANNRDILKRELRTARINALKTQNELLAYNDKRFTLLKEYVASENEDIAKLQNIMDLLNKEISGTPRQLIADTIPTSSRSTHLLDEFNSYQSDVSVNNSEDGYQDRGLDRARASLESKLSRLVAANESNGTSTSSQDGIAAGYSPHYQGIYIRTPSGVQTQLFDYISPLRDDTRVDTIDIDKDGDKDYIYILDGVLYVKYTWKQLPNKINDTTVKFSTITPDDAPPYVPDYFHENLSTPKNLNFSFVPAYPDETAWRLEFYDRYTEWDHVDIGDHDARISPKMTIDMFIKNPSIPIKDTSIISTPISRSLESVRDKTTFALGGRSIEVYTGALSISMSPGRILYTGRDSVEIKYTNQTNITPKTITLNPYTGYEFSDITEITTTGGKLYLIGEEDGSRYTYSDDLAGIPILPGMQIYGSDAGTTLRDHTSRSNIPLAGGATYMAYNLGDPALRYEVSVPYANGYYYARLQNLTKNKSDRAGVILLAPQASSDDGSPIVDLPSRIRLPIYSTREYKIADILTDLSSANITIDNDLTTDSNNDSISDNDFAVSGTGFEITTQSLKFGKFTVPGKYNMMLKAVDDMGNTTVMPLLVEAYTLIPQIQNVSNTGIIMGNLNEVVSDTPVHFFRVRPGEGPTILSPIATITSISGQFATGSFYKKPEIITLKSDSDTIVTNNHGIFSLPPNYHIDISSATEKSPMKFLTVNQSGSISHIHSISLPDNVTFIDTSKRNTNQATGVLMSPISGSTRIVPATSSDISIPGGMYITDMDHHPLVAIARDGNIYILDTTTKLRYTSKDGYLMIELVRANTVVANISYHIDFFYTMK